MLFRSKTNNNYGSTSAEAELVDFKAVKPQQQSEDAKKAEADRKAREAAFARAKTVALKAEARVHEITANDVYERAQTRMR